MTALQLSNDIINHILACILCYPLWVTFCVAICYRW